MCTLTLENSEFSGTGGYRLLKTSGKHVVSMSYFSACLISYFYDFFFPLRYSFRLFELWEEVTQTQKGVEELTCEKAELFHL